MRLAWSAAAVTIVVVGAVFMLPPIPQDPGYHDFADRLTLAGIPNFWNVVSNLPFALVGILGLRDLPKLEPHLPAPAAILFSVGAILVGAGSAWYHFAPGNGTLVWDRLPMTVAFMALFSLVISDRMSVALGRWLLWPLVFAGAASVLYWDWSELQGRGDLRAYGLVQFLPMLLIPLMLIMAPGRGLRAAWLWTTLAAYALAKLAEYFDAGIYAVTGFLSGHSIKHLLGALAVFFAIKAVTRPEKGTGQTAAAR
jgi:hypothetical protein